MYSLVLTPAAVVVPALEQKRQGSASGSPPSVSTPGWGIFEHDPAGSIDFCTFLKTLPRLVIFNRANAIEVAFRMCSRWGSTCNLNSAILDEKDMRFFVEER